MGRIWFIAEDESGYQIAREILKRRGIPVQVELRLPAGKNPNIFKLAAQIDRLIDTVRQDPKWNTTDCIAVLHDWDIHRQPDRTAYDSLRLRCEYHKKTGLPIKEVIAKDEIESWLIADTGICTWLGQKPDKKCDTQQKPTDILDTWCKKAGKPSYNTEKGLREALTHLAADGDKHSTSMREALAMLKNAPCIKP